MINNMFCFYLQKWFLVLKDFYIFSLIVSACGSIFTIVLKGKLRLHYIKQVFLRLYKELEEEQRLGHWTTSF
jgi:hypothetical protein